MIKENHTKTIAVIALLIAVIGVSIGFASYARTFNIQSTNTTSVLKGSDPFSTGLYLTVGSNNGTISDTIQGSSDKGVTWSGLTGTLSESTKSITYTATLNNVSSYIAYLSSVSSNGYLTCEAVNAAETNNDLVSAACAKLTLTVSINSYERTITTTSNINDSNLNDGSYLVNATNGTAPVTLTLAIDDSAVFPDGDFKVTIPAITFNYTSLKATD